MEPTVQKLTLEYLQALIGVKRLHSYYLIDQFEVSASSAQKTRNAFHFGRLTQEVEQLETLHCVITRQGEMLDCLTVN